MPIIASNARFASSPGAALPICFYEKINVDLQCAAAGRSIADVPDSSYGALAPSIAGLKFRPLHGVFRRTIMTIRTQIGVLSMAAALLVAPSSGFALDDVRYPNWKGQWFPVNPPLGGPTPVKFDPTKAWGRSQQAPLTPEYEKIFEDSMADQAKGGLGNYPPARCILGGMPRATSATRQEFIVTPETTYIVSDADFVELRRIYTDGREWPTNSEASYLGYSIGHWTDEGGDGRYTVLEIETRGPFKGPRAYDASGLPLHFDNQSTFKERLHLDKSNPNLLHDEITVYDHALTRPWSVDKTFQRNPNPIPCGLN
jgi:hypothetical protein